MYGSQTAWPARLFGSLVRNQFTCLLDAFTRFARGVRFLCSRFAHVSPRPYSTSEFDTYVFTAGTEPYASPLLDVLDPHGALKGRRYRQDCRRVTVASRGGQTQYLKDLTAVTDVAGLSRCVLVDNNPMSFVSNPSNGIPVPVRTIHSLYAERSDTWTD